MARGEQDNKSHIVFIFIALVSLNRFISLFHHLRDSTWRAQSGVLGQRISVTWPHWGGKREDHLERSIRRGWQAKSEIWLNLTTHELFTIYQKFKNIYFLNFKISKLIFAILQILDFYKFLKTSILACGWTNFLILILVSRQNSLALIWHSTFDSNPEFSFARSDRLVVTEVRKRLVRTGTWSAFSCVNYG